MSVAASRYARALIDVLYPQKADRGLQDLRNFSEFLDAEPVARQVFQNPTIAAERRKRLLKEVGDSLAFDSTTRNFLALLIDRNRMDLIEEIVDAYQKFLDEKMGVVRAHVTSVYPLESEQQNAVVQQLKAITGKEVRMDMTTDPTLIGGIVAQVGS